MASSIIPKALNGDISSLNDALSTTSSTVSSLSSSVSKLEPILISFPPGTTTITDWTMANNSDRRLLIFGNASNSDLCGIYVTLSRTVVCPIVPAALLTLSINNGIVTVVNSHHSNSANGIIMH